MQTQNETELLEKKQKLLDFSLFSAIARNDAKDVAELLAEGANVNAECPDELPFIDPEPWLAGLNALRFAIIVCKRPYEMIRVLVENGMDVKNYDGESALLSMLEDQDKETSEFLIKNGVNVNAKYDSGKTALMVSVKENLNEIATLLIEHGADVNAKTNKGRTALMCASYCGNLDIVKLLLAHNADPSPKDNDGKTAADYAEVQSAGLLVDTKLLARWGQIKQELYRTTDSTQY